MADIDLDIKNLPDDTYSVWLRRNSDGVEQFKSTLSFVGGLATAALSTASDGEYIEGAIFGNNNPAIRGVVISGYAYSVTRYFVNLDPTASAHYAIGTLITLTGDLTIDYVTSTTGTAMELAEGFEINSSGNFVVPASITDIELNGVSIGTGGAAALDGKLNTVKFIGAVSESVGDIGVGFDGIIANVVFGNASATTFKLDQEAANTESSIEANNSVTYQNIAQDEREEFTLTDDGWLSGELVVNGGFDTDSDWVKGAGWTISGGKANLSTSTQFDTIAQSGVGIYSGAVFITSYEISNYVSGDAVIKLGGGGGGQGASRTADGVYTELLTNTGLSDKVEVFNGIPVATSYSIDALSVKRLIGVA